MVPLREIRGSHKVLKAFLASFGLLGLILEGHEDQGRVKELERGHP